MDVLDVLWMVVTCGALINCLVFMIGYQWKTRGGWRKRTMGRHLMAFAGAMTYTFMVLVLSMAIGPLGPGPWIIALVLLNAVLIHRNYLLFSRRWYMRRTDLGLEDTQTEYRRRGDDPR